MISGNKCKGTIEYDAYNVGCYTSVSPSSSGAVNRKAVASIPTLIVLTSVIKWCLASDVATCLVSHVSLFIFPQ